MFSASIYKVISHQSRSHLHGRFFINAASNDSVTFMDDPFLLLNDRFPQFVFSTSARDLGVILDNSLTFSEHISNLTSSSYYQLWRFTTIHKSVSTSTMTIIAHAFICSRIDYCSSLLLCLPKV